MTLFEHFNGFSWASTNNVKRLRQIPHTERSLDESVDIIMEAAEI